MKCSCPKCSAPLPEDLSKVLEKGKNGKCSECNASYWIQRESFILRCYAVNGERYCRHCGEALGSSTYCPGCGTLYPDYCVVANKKPAQRAFEKKEFSLSLPQFSKKPGGKVDKQFILETGGKPGSSSELIRQLMMVGAGIALIAVIAVAVLFYMRGKSESQFATKYVVALYGIKSGTDQCLKISSILAANNPLAGKDLDELKSVKGEIASALQALPPPPEKFRDAHNRLLTLFGTYDKFYDLCITSGPATEVAVSAAKLEAQFTNQAEELKNALPPPLLAELTEKAKRYRNLQFLLE